MFLKEEYFLIYLLLSEQPGTLSEGEHLLGVCLLVSPVNSGEITPGNSVLYSPPQPLLSDISLCLSYLHGRGWGSANECLRNPLRS